jgi:aspartate aminotransferase
MPTSSLFSQVARGPVDPMFDLKLQLDADQSPHKIDLGAGVYRDESGDYYEFPVVKKVVETLTYTTERLMLSARQNCC